MKVKHATLVAAMAALPFAAMTSQSADARIRCNGPYQIVKGTGEIATPYCEDNYLAQVARRHYGMRYTARQIRQNPFIKRQACIVAGHDIRVNNICRGFKNEGGKGHD